MSSTLVREDPITNIAQNPQLIVGDITLEPAVHSIRLSGGLVRFTRKEYDLLAYFVLHQGRVIPRARLLASDWGDEANYGLRTVDVYIRRLRVKLAQSTLCRIDTVVNVGYKLVVDAHHATDG